MDFLAVAVSIAALTAILLLIYMYMETRTLDISHVDFSKGESNLKILHITDVHIHSMNVPYSRIIDAVKAEKPDIIILTGDYSGKTGYMQRFDGFLNSFTSAAIQAGTKKIFACMGNHDHKISADRSESVKDFIRILRSYGIEVLVNKTSVYSKNNKIYNITGIDDLRYGKPDIGKSFTGQDARSQANIVISHNPDIALLLPSGKADFLFAGHLHGGQVWLPFNLEFILLRSDILPFKGIRQGTHIINGITVYINRGLGNVLLPLRFLAKPEISVYTMP